MLKRNENIESDPALLKWEMFTPQVMRTRCQMEQVFIHPHKQSFLFHIH